MESFIFAAVGGVVIGVAASLFLILNGRTTGIAGIYDQLIQFRKGDTLWSVAFILGLVIGGASIGLIYPNAFGPMVADTKSLIFAGLLVGFGTNLGAGCTSEHALCGLSRFSKRSLIATITFMGVGFLVASLIQVLKGEI